jgi:putative ABC transport system substrate-binding protein
MRRRDFITRIGAAAATWPLAAHAQQPKMPAIGFLNAQTPTEFTHLVTAFLRGLNEGGFVEGQNVAIEYRWAERHYDRLPSLAADLVRRQVSVLVATGGAHAAGVASSRSIPIISSFGGDPIKTGFVESFNRPGKNVTGVMILTTDLEAKRLELLHELVSPSALIAVLIDPRFLEAEGQLNEVRSAARALKRRLEVVNVSSESEIDAAFATLVKKPVAGLAFVGNPLFNNRRNQLVVLTARHAIPAIHESREFTLAGGLMSYGTNVPEVYRQVGAYTARVLKGEKPADLPILLPTKFDMAINLKTAKSLGITMPTPLLLRADEVIE